MKKAFWFIMIMFLGFSMAEHGAMSQLFRFSVMKIFMCELIKSYRITEIIVPP